jgi:hypothetical protein
MRKVIQITHDPLDGDLTVLCNDGTVWYDRDGTWQNVPMNIPQDGYVDEEKIEPADQDVAEWCRELYLNAQKEDFDNDTKALEEALKIEEPERSLDSIFDNLEGPNAEAITRYLNDALNPDEDIDWEDQLDGSNPVPCYVSDSDIDDESMQYNLKARVISYRPLHEQPYIDVGGLSWKYAVPIGG